MGLRHSGVAMNVSWRERLIAEPNWEEFNHWPFIDTHGLSADVRRSYQRNVEIVHAVLHGEPLGEVARRHDLHPSRVTQLMNRCLGGPVDDEPALSRGLIHHQHFGDPSRHSPLPTHSKKRGSRCSFLHLLHSVPGLEGHLTERVRLSVRQSRRGQNLSAKALHASFLAYLDGQNWPRDAYPFTSVSRGYESVRRFLKQKAAELTLPKTPTRQILSRQLSARVFQEIQIDEHTIDCKGAAAVLLHDQMEPLRLSRISALVARDVATGCYLAHTVALTDHPSAEDVLALFDAMTRPWEPLELSTPGLSYAAEAPFPAALGESFLRPAFGIIRLDNALAHLSHSVRLMIVATMVATANFGLPRLPKGRNVIEQAFARLNVDIHRFPSTTGSHPVDPIKEPLKHQKKAPYVSLRVLEEVLSVLLAEFNVRPLANQGAISPIEQVRYQMNHHLLPLRAPKRGPALAPFESVREVTVRRPDHDHGPRINFEKVSYVGAALNSSTLINQKVLIRFDRRDIRTLHVQTLDGVVLGEVRAPRTWQRYPHSLVTRKRINRLIREGFLKRRSDPLEGYFDYTSAHRHLPSQALTLVHLSREFGHNTPLPEREEVAEPAGNNLNADDASVAKALKRLPDWDADMIRKRR